MKRQDILGVSSTVDAVSRGADIFAALVPPKKNDKMVPAGKHSADVKEKVKAFAPYGVGATVGAIMWKKHRVLGALAGAAAVPAALELVRGGDKKEALCTLAVDAAAIGGALYYKKHPAIGFVGGMAAGLIGTSFIQGSPARRLYERVKR